MFRNPVFQDIENSHGGSCKNYRFTLLGRMWINTYKRQMYKTYTYSHFMKVMLEKSQMVFSLWTFQQFYQWFWVLIQSNSIFLCILMIILLCYPILHEQPKWTYDLKIIVNMKLHDVLPPYLHNSWSIYHWKSLHKL